MDSQHNQGDQQALPTQSVLDALRTFCQRVASTVQEGKKEGVLRSTEDLYSRYPIDEGSVKQDEFGLKRINYATEEVTKESWFTAMRAVVWRLQESLDWSAILTILEKTTLGPDKAKRLLGSVAHNISYSCVR